MSYIAQLRLERIYGDTWHSSDTLSSFMPIFAARSSYKIGAQKEKQNYLKT